MRRLPKISFCLAICLLLAIARSNTTAQEVVTTSAELAAPTESQARQVERIRKMVHSFGHKASTPAQLVQLARGLDPAVAAGLFQQIADDYLRSGHCDLAANVLLQLLEQFPDEPVATDATLRLVQLYSSSEVAHTQRQTRDEARQLRLPPGWHKQSSNAEDPSAPEDNSANTTAGMLEYAVFLANSQLQRHPELAKHSPFAFQCATAARLSGRSQESKSWLTLLKHKRESGDWRIRALVEPWIADAADREAPMPTTRCLSTDKRPHLDGILNESLWLRADSFAPSSDAKEPKSEILLAYDDEYFYVAMRSQRISDVQYLPDIRPRTYDADLKGHDHVVLCLDADRDYATCYRLAVDHRGWTADACWLDTSWNPEWFVAAGGRTRSWTIEAAIPWTELAVTPPRAGDVWATSARRVAPSQQAPASAESPPEDFRLLIFD